MALQQIKGVALYLIDHERQQSQTVDPLRKYLGFTAGHGYGQFEHKAGDSLIAKFKEAGRTPVREIDV